jgi:hypothetical protein
MPNGNKTVSPCVNCKDPGVICKQVSCLDSLTVQSGSWALNTKSSRNFPLRINKKVFGEIRRIQNTEQHSLMRSLLEAQLNAWYLHHHHRRLV